MSRSAGEPSSNRSEPPPVDDPPALGGRLAWLTPKRLAFSLIGWMILFSLGSVFISNPFQTEPIASATPNFWHVMYLHGLLIAMVGLLALLACQVLSLRSVHTRVWITVGVVVATVFDGIGGVFDTLGLGGCPRQPASSAPRTSAVPPGSRPGSVSPWSAPASSAPLSCTWPWASPPGVRPPSSSRVRRMASPATTSSPA